MSIVRKVEIAWDVIAQKLKFSRDGGRRWRDLPSGGSVPGSVRRLDLGVVSVADVGDGSITLYPNEAGEMVGPVILYDATPLDGQLILVIGRDEQVIDGNTVHYEANPPLAWMEGLNLATDSYQMPTGLSLAPGTNGGFPGYITPVTFGPVTAGLIVGRDDAAYLRGWQANHVYAENATVLAAGHYWNASPGGTSGGSAPDFAGNIGGTVTDNDITWNDNGEIGTGGAHVYAEVCVPVAP